MPMRPIKLLTSAVLAIFTVFSWVAPASAVGAANIEPIATILLDKQMSTSRRIKAAKILGTFDDPRAMEALVRSLEVSGEPVRDVVIEVLRRGKGVEILAARAVNENLSLDERVLAVKGLRTMQNPVGFPALKQLLGSPTDQLRLEAAWALSMAGASTAEAELIRALNDPNKDVRYFVADALGRVKSPAAKTALENRKKVETDPAVVHVLQQATR